MDDPLLEVDFRTLENVLENVEPLLSDVGGNRLSRGELTPELLNALPSSIILLILRICPSYFSVREVFGVMVLSYVIDCACRAALKVRHKHT